MEFLSKTTAPTTVSPRAKELLKPALPVAITGLSLVCHAGDRPRSLISSILGQMSGVEISDAFRVKLGHSAIFTQARIAPIAALGDNTELERMYDLTTNTLATVAAQLSANVKPEKLLIVISVAPAHIMYLLKVDPQYLQSYLLEKIPHLASATFRILPNVENASTGALRTALDEMNEGKWQAIIFGGADSMISLYKCQELHDDNRLNTVANSNGLVPGEAAAFIVLQSTETAAKNMTPALGYLRGLGVAAEPNGRDADIKATEGLTSAINQALTQAGISATDIQGIVHNLGAETVQSFEWYKTTQKIWPRRVSEQQRMAVQMGEIEQAEIPDDPVPKIILPYMTMGETGAAALPMQLATALAWMEYDAHQARWGFPVRNHLLVCDTPEAQERGALIISTTLSAASQ